MPPTILLLGKNGQVGWELQRSMVPLRELVALGSCTGDNPTLDSTLLQDNLLQPAELARTIQCVCPGYNREHCCLHRSR